MYRTHRDAHTAKITERYSITKMIDQNNKPILIDAIEVSKILGIKRSRAYAIIRQLNAKLSEQGKITISGRINKKYLIDNFS